MRDDPRPTLRPSKQQARQYADDLVKRCTHPSPRIKSEMMSNGHLDVWCEACGKTMPPEARPPDPVEDTGPPPHEVIDGEVIDG